MKRVISLLLLSGFLLTTATAPKAQAAMVSLWVTGALEDGLTNSAPTTTGFGYGGGLLLDLHIDRGFAIETGGIYLRNTFDTTDHPGSIYVPADLRIHLAGPLSVSGGVYYEDFLSSGYDNDDGWEAGARLNFHGWFIDGRYRHGLKDQGGGLEYTSILALIGFRL